VSPEHHHTTTPASHLFEFVHPPHPCGAGGAVRAPQQVPVQHAGGHGDVGAPAGHPHEHAEAGGGAARAGRPVL